MAAKTKATKKKATTKATKTKKKRRPGRPRAYSNGRILAALRHKKVEGLVYLAADRLGCDPKTIYDRANQKTKKGTLKNPAIAAAIHDFKEKRKDRTELQLYLAIDDGEAWAIRFFLLNQARDRGYGDRLILERPDGGTGPHAEDMTDDELARIAALDLQDDKPSGSG